VPVSKDGESLPPLYWFSPRQAAGNDHSFFLPYAAFFRENKPELFKKTKMFLSSQEWLSWRLGSDPVTVLPNSSYQPYYWDDRQLASYGFSPPQCPPFAALGSITGRLGDCAARRASMTAGLPIVSGGPDFIMALLGSGAIREGLVCDRAGSSEGINVCVGEKPSITAASGEKLPLRVLPHAVEGLWNVGAVLSESGIIFDRYRMENGLEDESYDKTLMDLLGGKEFDAAAPLHPVLQSISEGLKSALGALSQAGFPVSEMRHAGGQAKSRLWNGIKAKLTGRDILVPAIADAELAGDAAAAMLALGGVSTISEACEKIVAIKETFLGTR
jgi:xylulokinase